MTAQILPRSRWWVLLATVTGVAITSSLGVWQLGRAEQKRQIEQQRAARGALPPLGWAELEADAPQEAWLDRIDRPVQLRGRWLHEATVYLDNRPMAGRTGFIVVTPLLAEDGQRAVAVQRGWVPRRSDDRLAVPQLPTGQGSVTVSGRLAAPPSRLYELGPDEQGQIRQNIDLGSYATQWSLPLPPVSVQQSSSETDADGLLRDWPRVGTDVHKHYGYATQWFGLSALMVFLYVWFQIIAPRRRRLG